MITRIPGAGTPPRDEETVPTQAGRCSPTKARTRGED